MATKSEFLQVYNRILTELYPWASNPVKLSKFLNSAHETLNGSNTWNFPGEACTKAWKEIGGKGIVTLKKLRALDET